MTRLNLLYSRDGAKDEAHYAADFGAPTAYGSCTECTTFTGLRSVDYGSNGDGRACASCLRAMGAC